LDFDLLPNSLLLEGRVAITATLGLSKAQLSGSFHDTTDIALTKVQWIFFHCCNMIFVVIVDFCETVSRKIGHPLRDI
jgi:hypothetical protein